MKRLKSVLIGITLIVLGFLIWGLTPSKSLFNEYSLATGALMFLIGLIWIPSSLILHYYNCKTPN